MATAFAKIEKEKYLELSNQTILFLKGKNRKIQSNLNNQMKICSSKRNYEKAAALRDRIKALNQIQEKQSINISCLLYTSELPTNREV